MRVWTHNLQATPQLVLSEASQFSGVQLRGPYRISILLSVSIVVLSPLHWLVCLERINLSMIFFRLSKISFPSVPLAHSPSFRDRIDSCRCIRIRSHHVDNPFRALG
ncbi:hypothetical protein AA313_de0200195 [Arthrobotrys entomopaga]|nr:hypothetical protein AA313_de0200195 [Arthrobotrys entomopaga]